MIKPWTFIELKCVLISLLFCASFLSTSVIQGQFLANQPEEIVAAGERNVKRFYEDLEVANFITGKVYSLRYIAIEGSQFFVGYYFEDGSLEYDGVLFESIPLQYDIYDQLVVTLFDSGSTTENISIDSNKIAWFSFAGLKFIHYKGGLLPNGIYQEFYNGSRSRVLIKRIKERVRNDELRKLYYKFNPIHKIYLLLDNQIFKIGNKKDLMNALDNDANVKRYIKSNRLRFDKRRLETSLERVMKYHDEL